VTPRADARTGIAIAALVNKRCPTPPLHFVREPAFALLEDSLFVTHRNPQTYCHCIGRLEDSSIALQGPVAKISLLWASSSGATIPTLTGVGSRGHRGTHARVRTASSTPRLYRVLGVIPRALAVAVGTQPANKQRSEQSAKKRARNGAWSVHVLNRVRRRGRGPCEG
jgi:hypothetical protein